MENPIKIDDLRVPIIFGNTHIGIIIGQCKDPYFSQVKFEARQAKLPAVV